MTPLERRSVGALALLYCFRMLGLFMVLPLLSLYARDLPDATLTRIGLALGMYGLANALLQIPLGWLSDKVGRKPVIIGGLVLFALGSAIAGMSETVMGIIVGRALQGAGAISSTLMALVADLTREEQRTKAMAVLGMSIGLSFAVALVLGPVVATFGGLPTVFWFTTVLAAFGIVILLLLVPTPATGVNAVEAGVTLGSMGRGLGDRELVGLNFGVFVLHFILVAFFLVVPGLIEHSLGVDRQHLWMVYAPVLLLSLVGMVPLMIVAERGGRLRQAFLLAITLVFVAMATLDFAATGLLIYVGLWLFFVGFNYLEATLPSLLSKSVSADGRGAAMGIYTTCQFLGAFAGGAGGGWLLEHLGSDALAGTSLLLAAIWWLLAVRGSAPVAAGTPGTGALPGVQEVHR